MARRPDTDRERLVGEHARVAAAMAFVSEDPAWGPPAVPDASGALARLAVDGGVLEPVGLHRIGVLLASGRTLREELTERAGDPLAPLRDRLHADRDMEATIGRTVDDEGEVLDSASRELARIRRALRGARGRIVQKLEAYVSTLTDRIRVADASVTIRNGRYVIPIRREGKGEVGGIVHDESASGATIFVEPPVGIELTNELKELERDEEREVHRILRELSAALAVDHGALSGSAGALVDFDSLYARARTALHWQGEPPELLEPGAPSFRIVRGRHPLLLSREDHVVPFDLDFEEGERALVVSGPNTGGKSVFLKSLGLFAALTQAGCVPPVGPGTRIPVFGDVFADIGDEQSIAESLSTFSAHLENLMELLAGADHTSLVLIDEMGTGTDPSEGAALARAILEELVEKGAVVVVTSHLGALKTLDTEGSGIVNASLRFDPERMEPTYHFLKGRPGRSYGLAIARRLGFPAPVLDRAEEHLSSGEASVEDLLAALEEKEREARELVEGLTEARDEAEHMRADVERREAEVRARERDAERRASEEARQLLLEAREQVEEAIRDVRSAAAEGGGEALEKAAHRARRSVEEEARRHRERTRSLSRPETVPELTAGGLVRLAGGARKGRVTEVEGDRATVEIGGIRMEVPAAELVPLPDEPAKDGGRGVSDAGDRGGWSGPVPDGGHEIDLRGLRVDEVELELGRGLDAAIMGDFREVRIIHGKGTGAVRSKVEELLGREKRVAGFRLGRPGEGGAGVTVATVSG